MPEWNRDVTVVDNALVIGEATAEEGPNDPPDNTDPVGDIHAPAGESSTINYKTTWPGLSITGLEIYAGSASDGLTWAQDGTGLSVTDSGTPGAEWSYYVLGTLNGEPIQSPDPQIHNSTSPPA